MSRDLPEPDWIDLSDALETAMRAYPDHDRKKVSDALVRAIYEKKIKTRGRSKAWFCHNSEAPVQYSVWDPSSLTVQWEANRIRIVRGDDSYAIADVRVHRCDVLRWCGLAQRITASTEGVEDQSEDWWIGDPVRYQQPLVVNRAKVVTNVSIEHPVHMLAHDRCAKRRQVSKETGDPSTSPAVAIPDQEPQMSEPQESPERATRLERGDGGGSIAEHPKQDWMVVERTAPGRTPQEKRRNALHEWGRKHWPDGNLPGRDDLLTAHRGEFGTVKGINELVMRKLRVELASDASKQGGAPAHRSR
jgi:hypothetical protein